MVFIFVIEDNILLSLAFAVGIGAIGAHFVTPTERFEKTFKTGSQYHFAHSVALLFGMKYIGFGAC